MGAEPVCLDIFIARLWSCSGRRAVSFAWSGLEGRKWRVTIDFGGGHYCIEWAKRVTGKRYVTRFLCEKSVDWITADP